MNDNNYKFVNGDACDLDSIDDCSVDAVVTDPPYGLAFMGKDWDDFEPKEYQEWCEEWASEVKRVLKCGGFLVAFSGSRTHHRLFAGVEDAGFEVRDTLTWHYGEGFPKGSTIDKYIDRYYTDSYDEREKIGENDSYREPQDSPSTNHSNQRDKYETKPASDLAEKWDGWSSQLKPASEFAVLAQKPLGEDAIYKNCIEYEVGALNIDACRIPSDGEHKDNHPDERGDSVNTDFSSGGSSNAKDGRYPSNLLLSPVAQELMDEQSGEVGGNTGTVGQAMTGNVYGDNDGIGEKEPDVDGGYNDSGGASRFFKGIPSSFQYCSKASGSERDLEGSVDNDHPTVKPIELMRWLVKLVCREEQTVLDPFMGSGTTALACFDENRRFIGVEKDEEYCKLASDRFEAYIDEE